VDLVGVIRAKAGEPAINYETWCNLVRRRPELVLPQPHEGRNPLTGEPCILHPRPDAAAVVIAGQRVGEFAWSQSGEQEVVVSGDPAVVIPLASEFAAAIGADFNETSACPTIPTSAP